MKGKLLILHAENNAMGGAEKSLAGILGHISCADRCLVALDAVSNVYKLAQDKYSVVECDIRYFKRRDIWRRPVMVLLNVVRVSARLLTVCHDNGISKVYCNTHRSLPYAMLLRLSGLTIICSCRDNIGSLIERAMIRFFCNKAIAVSSHVEKQLPRGIEKVVLHNGVEFGEFRQECRSPENSFDRGKVINIGKIANLEKWKNHMDLVRIAKIVVARNDNVRFYIIGSAPDRRYHELLEKEICNAGLCGHFVFTGFAGDMDVVLDTLDIVVHTAYDEPFGRSVVEAMGHGKPVVAFDNAGPAEIIRHGVTGYLAAPGSIESFADHVSDLVGNDVLRMEMGRRAAQDARQKFGIDPYVSKFEEYVFGYENTF